MYKQFFISFSFVLVTVITASGQVLAPTGPQSQSTDRAEVLVLGTYHMANPGHDIFNMQADDVLKPKRQAEIAQLIEVLKKFHPTKIAIESDVYSQRAPKQYADYVDGK